MRSFKHGLNRANHGYIRLKNILNRKRLLNITHDGQGLFIHIPKTAGTSISQLLKIKSFHTTAIEAQNIVGNNKYKSYYSFCVLRNPLDRFISLYKYAQMDVSHYHDNKSVFPWPKTIHLDYDILCNKNINESVDFLVNDMLKNDLSYNQWHPQSTWITNDKKEVIVNHIARFDRIQSLEKMLKDRFKIEGVLQLKNISIGNSKLAKGTLTRDSRLKLEDYYREDMELFDSLM